MLQSVCKDNNIMLKRVVYVLAVMFIAVWIWNVFIYDIEPQLTIPSSAKHEKVAVEESSKPLPESYTATDDTEVTVIRSVESDNNITVDANCHARYQKHENWQEINIIFESLYMSIEEMSGEHHYQQLPLEAVKSYADAGDADAMFHYGTELFWKGGFGFYFNELNRSKALSQSERREVVNNHKLDMVTLEQGSKYLLNAAIEGKLGGIIELSLLSHHVAKRQVSSGKDVESIKQALMISLAYDHLLGEVFINDTAIMKGFLFVKEKGELLDKFAKQYPDVDLEPMRDESIRIHQRLFDYWQEKRDLNGAPVYPDKFPQHLEQHMANKNKECQ